MENDLLKQAALLLGQKQLLSKQIRISTVLTHVSYIKYIKKSYLLQKITYVNVKGKWNYICLILDLFNREIIGYAAGKRKTASIVTKAFSSIQRPLNEINILHTDRGNEFKNKSIDQLLSAFSIDRSLSKKGCPYDNAVA